jgi:hypothetical protein
MGFDVREGLAASLVETAETNEVLCAGACSDCEVRSRLVKRSDQDIADALARDYVRVNKR